MRPTLSVAAIAAATGKSVLSVQRALWRWRRDGWPRVTRVAGPGRGGYQLRVDAADYDALLAREMTAAAWHALRAMGALPPELAEEPAAELRAVLAGALSPEPVAA